MGAPNSATVTIADGVPNGDHRGDRRPTPRDRSDPGVFTFTRTGPTTFALQVNFDIGGTATNGADYQAIGAAVTIPAGQASATVTITPAGRSAHRTATRR